MKTNILFKTAFIVALTTITFSCQKETNCNCEALNTEIDSLKSNLQNVKQLQENEIIISRIRPATANDQYENCFLIKEGFSKITKATNTISLEIPIPNNNFYNIDVLDMSTTTRNVLVYFLSDGTENDTMNPVTHILEDKIPLTKLNNNINVGDKITILVFNDKEGATPENKDLLKTYIDNLVGDIVTCGVLPIHPATPKTACGGVLKVN